MEIECTPRNLRSNELAPIGAYLSDEDGLKALLGARATRCSKIAGGRQSEFCLTLTESPSQKEGSAGLGRGGELYEESQQEAGQGYTSAASWLERR